MADLPADTRATVIPCLCYRDPKAAIRWLCDTFGFVSKAVYEGDDGSVMHSELTFGNGMVMVGSVKKDTDYGRMIAQPDEIGGRDTTTVYCITGNPDEIYRRAQAAGAKMIRDIRDEDYGGRGFVCTDLEGHVWSFGSYDPWK